ncbi:MAG: GntR family transcriptional regulator [Eubacteriales bacterium]|nr:GntR family transcriptional regulator [Eubacteriales bacterium]
MLIEMNFQSDEALYMQLRNQIILRIAMSELQEGDTLPSVRQLAEDIGINMHTVNKAYALLRREGYLQLDRRRGAVVALSADKVRAIEELRAEFRVLLAGACCQEISREEIHALVDELLDELQPQM